MTARKSERLMNLVICLLVARTYLSKDQIKQAVEGYRDQESDAFEKMFERDKEELRTLGVPIEVGSRDRYFDDELGYRIPRDRFELPEVVLEADEAAVVGLAARIWQHASLADATTNALRKLRAGGVPVDTDAVDVVEPLLAATEPAFDPVFDAVTRHAPISFEYRAPGRSSTQHRELEPWGLVSWHGHWYVAGHDRDRGERRMFRLSRFDGPVRTGRPGTVRPPADLDLRALADELGPDAPRATARVAVRKDAGGWLRRRAAGLHSLEEPALDEPGLDPAALGAGEWDVLEVPFASAGSLAEEITALGSDAVALAPDQVRDAVVRQLRRLAGRPAS